MSYMIIILVTPNKYIITLCHETRCREMKVNQPAMHGSLYGIKL